MATVIVHTAGLLTTVQDRGRYGYQRFGMPLSGAMDVFSLEMANLLVGNDPGDACLEATTSGPELEFTGATWIAITGHELPLVGFEPLSPPGRLSNGSARRKPRLENIPEGLILEYKHEQIIRVIPGPEVHYFDIAGLRSFLSTEFTVTAQSDRMGYRQTSGGYACIANVITVNLTLLAQMRPEDKLRFEETTLEITHQFSIGRFNNLLTSH